jgi:hypothetical protein
MYVFAIKNTVVNGLILASIPVSFLLLGALQLYNFLKISPRWIKVLEVFPLILSGLPLVYLVGRTLRRPGVELTFQHFFDFFGYGLLIIILCGLFVALSPFSKIREQ